MWWNRRVGKQGCVDDIWKSEGTYWKWNVANRERNNEEERQDGNGKTYIQKLFWNEHEVEMTGPDISEDEVE